MHLEVPDINDIVKTMLGTSASFDGRTIKIKDWVSEHRSFIADNNKLIENKSEANDVAILLIFVRDLLVRAMHGERGMKTYYELQALITSKHDLNEQNYKEILKRSQYRWGVESGTKVISDVVKIFRDHFKWNWKAYLIDADKYYEEDYPHDPLLGIKNIGYKVRDLALANFNKNYIAIDLHVARMMTRLGLINYGYSFAHDKDIELGTNTSDDKNYLFLRRLAIYLSKMTNNEYSPADLDKIFWFYGKTFCGATPFCQECAVRKLCLTGQFTNKAAAGQD